MTHELVQALTLALSRALAVGDHVAGPRATGESDRPSSPPHWRPQSQATAELYTKELG
jgi:hypothetical protein